MTDTAEIADTDCEPVLTGVNVSTSAWDYLIATHWGTVFHTCRAVAPTMAARQ
jgi:NADP-dependent 3-hydroxy acid dehydrogenase YdfG